MPAKQVKATFYLPLKDNDSRDLSEEIAQVEEACYLAFGAWTLSGYFKGVWRMQSGERKVDTSAVYTIVLPKGRVRALEVILKTFKAKTQQEAIYLEIEHDVDVRFL
jgi:hypothetical protein